MSKIIKIKRGRKIGLPSLSKGELGYAKDTQELYIGDGETNVLVNSTDGGKWVTPIVDITNITAESVTFTIQNLEDFEVDVKYDLNTPPTANSITLAANTTSSELTITGLDAVTNYILYAQSFLGNDAISTIISNPFTSGLPDDPFIAPGATTFVASTTSTNPETSQEETSGFFGLVDQTDFGTTMTQVMSDLGITGGLAQFTTDPLLKFLHRGKIKYINQKPIRWSLSWGHIQARLVANGGNVYGGAPLTIGGRNYKVRLMRGWGQVSANTNGTGTPNYETGPLMSISFPGYGFTLDGNNGVNWPTNTSPWNAASPNEWNTLMFPIASATQSQTASTPDWASYSNAELLVASGYGQSTWTQETASNNTGYRVVRGFSNIAHFGSTHNAYYSNSLDVGLRFVFELDETLGGGN